MLLAGNKVNKPAGLAKYYIGTELKPRIDAQITLFACRPEPSKPLHFHLPCPTTYNETLGRQV